MADNFEKDWRKALHNIDITPDPIVWDRVNHTLAESEVVFYKKKANRYKWAAVAAVLIAFSVSIPQIVKKRSASNQLQAVSFQDIEPMTSLVDRPVVLASTEFEAPINTTDSSLPVIFQEEDRSVTGSSGGVVAMDMEYSEQSASFMPMQIETRETLPILQNSNQRVPEITIYKKAEYRAVVASASQDFHSGKRFWAGLGVGSSSFDPNYQLNQPNEVVSAVMRSESNFVSRAPESLDQEASFSDRITEGVNYQFGVNLGVMLGNRLSLESGFNYAEAQLASHTDLVVENKIFAKSVAVTSEMVSVQQVSQVTNTQDIIEYERTDISLDNTFQFASIPLKAGYQVVNKKIQVKLNAGFITNIYMGNTLTDESDQVASLQLFPGANSPYRTVSFSGITGISVGYNLFNALDLTLEPNFSQALQPLTKENSNFNATPNGFGMIAGLRYRFGN